MLNNIGERLGVLVLHNSVNLGAVVLLNTEANGLVRLEVVAVLRHGIFVDEGELESGNAVSVR